ncbi:hypothetical protein GGR51DRAFT_544735 [Nemania sp. FL0031]|nr:hypothetical protein GGR51DRAFT_544735 [Nemania sp. FL0031]
MRHVRCINVLLGRLKSIPDNSGPGQKGQYLGLEKDHDRVVRYSLDRMEWVADHEDIHDLVKYVLKQEDFLKSRARNRFNDKLLTIYSTSPDSLIPYIQRFAVSLMKKDKTPWAALEWAVYWGRLELVKRMLASDNNTNEVQEDAKIMAQIFYNEINRLKEKPKKRFGVTWSQSPHPKRNNNRLPNINTKEQELYEKLREIEEDYVDIRVALQYGNPGIVKIADVKKALRPPGLDQTTRESIGDFFAGIIDVYDADDGVALLRRSRRVDDVIYDKGPRVIMESARARVNKSQAGYEKPSTKLGEEDLQLRWVHLPANNMRWMEDLSAKLRCDKRPGSKEQKPSDPDSISRDFLQRSWHQLPMGMKPACLKLTIGPKTGNTGQPEVKEKGEEKGGGGKKISNLKLSENDVLESASSLALYMPYFTFSTLTNEEYNAKPTGTTDPQTRKGASVGPSPSSESTILKIIRSIKPIIRAVRLGSAESQSEKSQIGESPSSETEHTLSTIPQVKTYQKLIDAYKDRGSILHVSRTLDEYFHYSFPDKDAQEDLDYRNRTQVISKRIQDIRAQNGCPGDWTIIRVDHLWLWIIDEKTIISSSTHRMDKAQDPILEGIWKHMNSDEVQSGRRSLPSSPYKMAQFITDFCINFFHTATCKVTEVAARSSEVRQVEESIPEIFKNEINKTSREEAKLLDGFTCNIRSVISDFESKETRGTLDLEVHTRKQVKRNFESIEKASELLKQIKDIRDELNMLKSVLTQQKSVWNELNDLQFGNDNLSGPAYAINSIDEMDSQAARVQTAVISILDLEQNKASIQEAVSSREQAQESIRQGRTLMAFTVVTIFFLPLFALNIAIFPHSGEDVYWPDWVFGITFGLTVALLAIILTVAFYLDSVRQFVKKFREIFKQFFEHLDEKIESEVASARTPTSAV